MMKASKLSNLQQKYLDEYIKDQSHLPLKSKLETVIREETATGASGGGKMSRASISNGYARPHMRSLNQIVQSGAYNVTEDSWRPKPTSKI